MRKTLLSIALGVAAAGGVVALAGAPASAGGVSCSSAGFGSYAWANGCSHSGAHDVRLVANCDWSPWNSYSPYLYGNFSGANFKTSSCANGVEESYVQHR